MKQQPSDRAIILGEYILEHKATVRAAAAWFGISKSTVHKDVSQRLSELSPSLYEEVRGILAQNKQERHIRGGMATKKKYEELAMIQQAGAGLTAFPHPLQVGISCDLLSPPQGEQ